MSLSIRAMHLAEKIAVAFHDTEVPRDDQIVDNTEDLECLEIQNAFKGKSWDSLDLSFLLSFNSAISFFSSKAYHYYMPAFLLAIVGDFRGADILSDFLLGSFSVVRLEAFTIEQLEIILQFLDYIRDEHGEDFFEWQIDIAYREVLSALEVRRRCVP